MSLVDTLLGLFRPKPAPAPPEPDSRPHTPSPPPASNFERALAFTLKWEGGKVDDPVDPGGRTNMGITQRTYDSWNAQKGAITRDVWTITPAEVANIYRQAYWFGGRCDALLWPLSLVHFDSCVQFGPAAASARFLKNTSDPFTYINLRRDWHRKRVSDAPSQARFLQGWLNRCNALEREARS